jgi:hypothetical protein
MLRILSILSYANIYFCGGVNQRNVKKAYKLLEHFGHFRVAWFVADVLIWLIVD